MDSLAYRAGSVFNIHLYKLWIEIHGGAAPVGFAIWYNLGTQYNAYGDVANSVISYKNALALKPDFHQAVLNLGLAYEAAGDIPITFRSLDIGGESRSSRSPPGARRGSPTGRAPRCSTIAVACWKTASFWTRRSATTPPAC